MKRPKNFAIHLWIGFILILFSPNLSNGQIVESHFTDEISGDPSSRMIATFIKSPNGGPATTVNLDFNVSSGSASGWTVSGFTVNGAATVPPFPVIINDAATGAATLTLPSALPTAGTTPGLATIEFTVGANGGVLERSVLVKIRKPLDIVLVLDRSGSMECGPASYDFPSCITSASDFATLSRWAKLKTAVHNLTSKLVETSLTGDRISITLFDGDLKTTASGTINTALLTGFLDLKSAGLASNVDAILNDQTQPLGRNGTAIGKGMKDAVGTKLNPPDANHRRVIMLFTDGYQNVDPSVKDTDPDKGKVLVSPPFTLNNGVDPDIIEKFVVGLTDGSGAFNDLLKSIASDPVTNTAFTITGSEELFGTLLSGDFFNNLFAGFSPETISENRNSIGSGFTEKIVCDSTVERLFLEVYLENDNTRSNNFRVFHRGQDVTAFGNASNTITSVLFTFNSNSLADAHIPMAGTWELRSTRLPGAAASTNSKYLFTATADDNAFHMQCDPGGKDWKVNDVVKPTVKLSLRGKPLSGAKVTALLIGPADDLANALANEQVNTFDPSQDPNAGTLFTQKLGRVVAANPNYLEKFIEKNPSNQIVLTNVDSNGTYSGSFSKALNMSGIHHLIYFIEYIKGADSIIRRERQSLVVRFGDIDLSKSAITFTVGSAGNLSTLLITPVDNRGMKIGLGYGGLFHLESPNAKIASVKENLDGSYLISIDGSLSGDARLTVMDVEIFKGRLSHLKCYGPNASFLTKFRCWLEDKGIPEWLFWLLLALLLLLIIWILRRKK
ncbi:MAG TPA: vWA domain-containing protein [Chitinophagaceae bacterium]|jgi:hypothetical protein|nr:vWA domain-containing protein [Chitinophagaceae bacterium]